MKSSTLANMQQGGEFNIFRISEEIILEWSKIDWLCIPTICMSTIVAVLCST
jgi:hypothetical protein